MSVPAHRRMSRARLGNLAGWCVVIAVAGFMFAHWLMSYFAAPAPPLPSSLVGKVVWINGMAFDTPRLHYVWFYRKMPCRVIAVNVNRDGPKNGSLYCSVTDAESGWAHHVGWTSTFVRHK